MGKEFFECNKLLAGMRESVGERHYQTHIRLSIERLILASRLNIFHMMFHKNQVLIRRMAGFLPVFSLLPKKLSWMKNLRAIECGYQWQTPNINCLSTF